MSVDFDFTGKNILSKQERLQRMLLRTPGALPLLTSLKHARPQR